LGEALRFPFDLLPGAAGDAPAGQLQELLSPAVVLESGVGVMKAAAVGLNDQAGVSPEEVGLEPTTADTERHVDLGCLESAVGTHAEKHALQFAASPLGLRVKFVENEAKPCDPTPAMTTLQQSAQNKQVDDPQYLSLGQRLPQLPRRDERRQIEQRPLHGRTRNPAHTRRIARCQRTVSMRVDARWMSSATVWGCYVDPTIREIPDPPQCRRGSM
jgi:hypothetical protein